MTTWRNKLEKSEDNNGWGDKGLRAAQWQQR